jgi:hypothetical protein
VYFYLIEISFFLIVTQFVSKYILHKCECEKHITTFFLKLFRLHYFPLK